jgi:sigma 54 modulation/S30EA-like ribosomal protein
MRHRAALPHSLPRRTKLTRNRVSEVPPPAHIRVIGADLQEESRDHISRKLGAKLAKFASSIERVTVRVSDDNGPKGGHDQICQIKVVLIGLPSVVVEGRDTSLEAATNRAMKAATLAVRRTVQRRRLKALHHRVGRPSAGA